MAGEEQADQSVCRHFLRQMCNYGEGCKFKHDSEALAEILAAEKCEEPTEVHIAFIPPDWDPGRLARTFERYGVVRKSKLEGNGMGSVTMSNGAAAARAVQEVPGMQSFGQYKLNATINPDRDFKRKRRHPFNNAGSGEVKRAALGDLLSALGPVLDQRHQEQQQLQQVALQEQHLIAIRDRLLAEVQKKQLINTTYMVFRSPTHEDLAISVKHGMLHIEESIVPTLNNFCSEKRKIIALLSIDDQFVAYGNVTSAVVSRPPHLSLPKEWIRCVSINWVSVDLVNNKHAASPSGTVLPSDEGKAICTALDNPKQSTTTQPIIAIDLPVDVDVSNMGYEEYLQLMKGRTSL